jgi:hypothetical protein
MLHSLCNVETTANFYKLHLSTVVEGLDHGGMINRQSGRNWFLNQRYRF